MSARGIGAVAMRGVLLGLAGLAGPMPAYAQRAPAVPPTRSDIERLPQTDNRPRPTPRLTISGGVERAPCPLEEPRFAAITVTLRKVEFDRLEDVAARDLAAAYTPFLGRPVPIAAVCEIRDAAATMLRRRGYLAAVQVPAQRIEDGTLRLSVLMAKLVAVHVRGDAGHAEQRIAGYLNRLATGRAFNSFAAERALLLADDLPGFDVHLALRSAGANAGEVVGDVTVTRTPYRTDLNLQDYGSRTIGRWSGLASVELNDLLGLGDRAVLGLYNTFDRSEQTVLQGSYEMRPGASGTTFALRGTYAWTRPDVGGGNPIEARTLIATGEIAYPFVRRQALTIRGAAGLDVIDQRLRFGGLPFTHDSLRVAYGRVDLLAQEAVAFAGAGPATTEPRWRAALAVELRQGLSGLGASKDCGPAPLFAGCRTSPSISRIDANPQATLIRLGGTVTYKLTPRVTLAVSPRAQIAFDPLLSFEQLSAGNYTVGRGYDPGALTGDSGYGAQTELRFGPVAVPRLAGTSVQPFVFFDSAAVTTLGTLPGPFERDHLASAGAGIRATVAGRAFAEVTLAQPIGPPPIAGTGHGLRLLVSLSTSISPGN